MTQSHAQAPAVDIRHLDKRLGEFRLRDVNLTVPSGYITGFVGPNGAGKTSTIKCLLGMLLPDAGTIQVLGRPAGTPTEEIGIVLDSPSLVGEWTVAEVGRAIGRFYASWQPARFAHWCERLELPSVTRIKQLSRGMGMKLQIALALSRDTRLLVMDEPTSGLDPLARDDLLSILGEYLLDERNTVLFSTHITADLERVADYVAVIVDGRILHAEPKDDLLARYVMVRGGPQDLSERARACVHGLRTHAGGFEGLVAVTELARFGDRVDVAPASLDELVIHLSRKAER